MQGPVQAGLMPLAFPGRPVATVLCEMSGAFQFPQLAAPWAVSSDSLKHGESRQACWRTLKRARESANPSELHIPEMEEEGPGGRGGEVTGSEGRVHFSLWRQVGLGVSLRGGSWQEVRGTD